MVIFQCTKELNIIMKYYTVDILTQIKEIMNIVSKLGKIVHNCLLMGIWTYRNIYKSKSGNINGDIHVVNIYINDILKFNKEKLIIM